MRNEAQTLEQTVTFTVPGFEKYIKNVAIAAYIKRAPQAGSLGAAFCILNLLDVEVIFCGFEKM